ncbi:glutamate receptor ionotropic, kainate 2-like [Procambarus clarkii]|uniref:glutamate receptor ionotropic, kainate 2-like n=1 Tax=Procambarus clarkii TaxID=6728 RepID=UPI001E673E81|nr:uncharacterized protein LOC123750908 [Procambarus clarkii]
MVTALKVTAPLLFLPVTALLVDRQLHLRYAASPPPATARALQAVVSSESDSRSSLVFFTDGAYWPTTVLKEFMAFTRSTVAVTLFEGEFRAPRANLTQVHLSWMTEARRVRQVSWCVTVVVVSDDLAFLTAFAQWSLTGRLLVWSTRLLVVTRLPLHHLHVLHGLLSMTNSMLLVVHGAPVSSRCSVYIQLPYSPRGAQALKVASWTPHQGLALTSSLHLFPDKFSRFIERPSLKIAVDQTHLMSTTIRLGRREDETLEYLGQGLNFTYKYTIPSDGLRAGVVDMVVKQGADFALGPLGVSLALASVVDFMWPITVQYSRILGTRGRPEVDPWGFVFPLELPVWAATMTTLLMLSLTLFLASTFLSLTHITTESSWERDSFHLISALLQQDCVVSGRWWWRRLVFLLWMMMAAQVLVKSYSGNLMSGLAVRHIKQPYQTLRSVVDDPSAIMMWLTDAKVAQNFSSVQSGIYREVFEAGSKGRIVHRNAYEFLQNFSALLSDRRHVLIGNEILFSIIISKEFSRTGNCYYYLSRERLLPSSMVSIGQKNSPLVPALSKRILAITEFGLYNQWVKTRIPNGTSCANPPTRITTSSTLSLNSLWGIFVVLACGLIVSGFCLCLEVTSDHLLHYFTSTKKGLDNIL